MLAIADTDSRRIALVMATCLAAGLALPACGGSAHSGRAKAAIRAVTSVRREFKVFPSTAGSADCDIPVGGFGRHKAPGRCSTDVRLRKDGTAVVTFKETWNGQDARIKDEPARPGLVHVWEVFLSASGRITSQLEQGQYPPQYMG